MTLVRVILPVVTVPVLSSTIVSTLRVDSRVSGPLMRTPICAPRPVPTSSAVGVARPRAQRSEEHTSELQSRGHLVCRLLLAKKNPMAHEISPESRPGANRKLQWLPCATGGCIVVISPFVEIAAQYCCSLRRLLPLPHISLST